MNFVKFFVVNSSAHCCQPRLTNVYFLKFTCTAKTFAGRYEACSTTLVIVTLFTDRYPVPRNESPFIEKEKYILQNYLISMAAMPFPCNGPMLCCVILPYFFKINLLVVLSLISIIFKY